MTKKKRKKPKKIDWDKQPLGVKTDASIARKLGVRAPVVRRARIARDIPLPKASQRLAHKGIDWSKQPLGEVGDLELSKTLGVTQASVYSARRTRGIPPVKPRPSHLNGPKHIDWDAQPLGKESDALIAMMLDVTVSSVALARRKRGLTSVEERRGISWTND